MFSAGGKVMQRASGGAFFSKRGAGITQLQNNAIAFGSPKVNFYEPSFVAIDKIRISSASFIPSGDALSEHAQQADGFPSEIPPGQTGISFLWAIGRHTGSSPMYGSYLIRHTLPGGYTITGSGITLGATTTVDVNGTSMTQIEATIAYPQSNISITVSGPVGAIPAWDIQFFRTSDQMNFDDTSMAVHAAQRFFVPEFLNLLQRWKPHHMRFMDWIWTTATAASALADYPDMSNKIFPGQLPIEIMVSLCNYIGMGGWFTFPMNASNDLFDGWCDYIIANMDTNLPVYLEHGNEHWNFGFQAIQYYVWEGLSRFGTQGAGTVSFDMSTRTITGTGTPDFTTIFGSGGKDRIAFAGLAYILDTSQTTATTLKVQDWFSSGYFLGNQTDVDYFYPPAGDLMHSRGYMVRSTLAMRRITSKFLNASQMDRLTRVYGSQTADLSVAGPLTDAPTYWTTSDYIDPLTMHDAVAITSYFGGGDVQPGTDFAVHLKALADTPNQQGFNEAVRDHMLGIAIPSVAVAGQALPTIKASLQGYRDFCDTNGLDLLLYEGSSHMIESGVDASIYNAWTSFMISSEAAEVFEEWRDIVIPYVDGPHMKYIFMDQPPNASGDWGLHRDYDEATDAQKAVIDEMRQWEPYWLPDYPPRAVAVPEQSWSADVDPGFDLKDFVSVNATSFSGTPPVGTTLNTSTGVISGSPITAAAADYTLTASNGAGVVDVVINITVT